MLNIQNNFKYHDNTLFLGTFWTLWRIFSLQCPGKAKSVDIAAKYMPSMSKYNDFRSYNVYSPQKLDIQFYISNYMSKTFTLCIFHTIKSYQIIFLSNPN